MKFKSLIIGTAMVAPSHAMADELHGLDMDMRYIALAHKVCGVQITERGTELVRKIMSYGKDAAFVAHEDNIPIFIHKVIMTGDMFCDAVMYKYGPGPAGQGLIEYDGPIK